MHIGDTHGKHKKDNNANTYDAIKLEERGGGGGGDAAGHPEGGDAVLIPFFRA